MGQSCFIDSQCITDKATCRSNGLGDTTCQCSATGQIYDSDTDACLAGWSSFHIVVYSELELHIAYKCKVGIAFLMAFKISNFKAIIQN